MDPGSIRRFDTAPGEPTGAGGYTTSLFTRIGTRSGVITAFYEHVPSVSSAVSGEASRSGPLAKAVVAKKGLPKQPAEGHYDTPIRR